MTECTTCPAGYECPYGNYSSICVAGLSAVPGSEHCAACLAGTYSDVAGSAECQSCPAGYGCTSSTVAPVACVIGQYALAGAGECTTCPVGMSCPTVDTAPVACLSGSISMAGITNCTLCPAGSYCGPGYEIPCPLGTYSSGHQLCAISLLYLCSHCAEWLLSACSHCCVSGRWLRSIVHSMRRRHLHNPNQLYTMFFVPSGIFLCWKLFFASSNRVSSWLVLERRRCIVHCMCRRLVQH